VDAYHVASASGEAWGKCTGERWEGDGGICGRMVGGVGVRGGGEVGGEASRGAGGFVEMG